MESRVKLETGAAKLKALASDADSEESASVFPRPQEAEEQSDTLKLLA